jgi:hypothetical protein
MEEPWREGQEGEGVPVAGDVVKQERTVMAERRTSGGEKEKGVGDGDDGGGETEMVWTTTTTSVGVGGGS